MQGVYRNGAHCVERFVNNTPKRNTSQPINAVQKWAQGSVVDAVSMVSSVHAVFRIHRKFQEAEMACYRIRCGRPQSVYVRRSVIVNERAGRRARCRCRPRREGQVTASRRVRCRYRRCAACTCLLQSGRPATNASRPTETQWPIQGGGPGGGPPSEYFTL